MGKKFTPGPWEAEQESENGIVIFKAGHPRHALVQNDKLWLDEESIANANLIQYAPDLLESLEGLMALIETEYRNGRSAFAWLYNMPQYQAGIYVKAKEVINKAQGLALPK